VTDSNDDDEGDELRICTEWVAEKFLSQEVESKGFAGNPGWRVRNILSTSFVPSNEYWRLTWILACFPKHDMAGYHD
jgi:hypothetical protein